MNFKHYFQKAKNEGWAIGQFNIANLETLQAIVLAAQRLKSPVIIGTSEGESKFLGLARVVALTKAWQKEINIPFILNLDHGKSLSYIKKAIDSGYNAVHFDGSKLPLSENIRETKRVIKYARNFGVFVEGEVGVIGGALTDPNEALKFVKETGVDNLAVNIGTFHGLNASGKKRVNLQKLKEIKEKVAMPLVLHGGSGVANRDIREAIKLGIVKININTELRIAFSKTLRTALQEKPKEIVPYQYMPRVIKAVQKVVENKIRLFGSINKA